MNEYGTSEEGPTTTDENALLINDGGGELVETLSNEENVQDIKSTSTANGNLAQKEAKKDK